MLNKEVRRVPADWEHPRLIHVNTFKPLYAAAAPDDSRKPEECMPTFAEGAATHLMLYSLETNTPESPVFTTVEKLATYLAEARLPVGHKEAAPYEVWLTLLRNNLDDQSPRASQPDGNADVLPVQIAVARPDEPRLPDAVPDVQGAGSGEAAPSALPTVRGDDREPWDDVPEVPG